VTTAVCFSGQHDALARDIAREVGVVIDVEAGDEYRPSTLSESLADLLVRIEGAARRTEPRGVIVQGDTTTALAGALVGFYRALPIFHVEAGLRTTDPLRPFPEEMNRRLLSRVATVHFAPTETARDHLLAEGVPASSIELTGNTIVDALARFLPEPATHANEAKSGRSIVVVTLHRRENLAAADGVARAVTSLAERDDVEVIWIRHPNPTNAAALARLDGSRVVVLEPQPYRAFLSLLARARVVMTDSGGIQEEAPALGVPVVVLRNETDRPEAVRSGNALVVGADPGAIVRACSELLDDAGAHRARSRRDHPFGDGHAATRIVARIERHFANT
jgi:UDP-N-acetylglucosamine 2-epimerase (non-hydrolysing)